MRKTVLLASLLSCMQLQARELGAVAYLFDVILVLPASCVLYARPSVIDKDIRFHCPLKNAAVIDV